MFSFRIRKKKKNPDYRHLSGPFPIDARLQDFGTIISSSRFNHQWLCSQIAGIPLEKRVCLVRPPIEGRKWALIRSRWGRDSTFNGNNCWGCRKLVFCTSKPMALTHAAQFVIIAKVRSSTSEEFVSWALFTNPPLPRLNTAQMEEIF